MIRSRLREVAAGRGITNAYQFQKLTNFSISMAYGLWRDEWERVHMKTLNTLCNLLECSPNDLLEFTPDQEESL